jgi:phenylalanyl-tRNA synthetase beta chain
MFAQLRIKDVEYERLIDNPVYHPGRSAKIMLNGKQLGVIGEVHPSVARNFEIGTKTYIGEIDFTAVFNAVDTDVKYVPLTRFPAMTRDFSIVVDKMTPVAAIEKVIKKAGGKLLSKLELSDVYTGSQIPEDKKSVMYKAEFKAPDRSLTGEEADNLHAKIVKNLGSELGAELR